MRLLNTCASLSRTLRFLSRRDPGVAGDPIVPGADVLLGGEGSRNTVHVFLRLLQRSACTCAFIIGVLEKSGEDPSTPTFLCDSCLRRMKKEEFPGSTVTERNNLPGEKIVKNQSILKQRKEKDGGSLSRKGRTRKNLQGGARSFGK